MRDNKDIKRIVELCDRLDDDNPDHRDVKKYLTQFLVIKACGIYENEIDKIIYERVRRTCDEEVTSFVSGTVSAYKHLSINSLKGNILAKFSTERKREFAEKIKGSGVDDAYMNIVNARNEVAHGHDTAMTYNEFIKNSDGADCVIVELEAVLRPG